MNAYNQSCFVDRVIGKVLDATPTYFVSRFIFLNPKDIILEKGIIDVAVRHLKDSFAVTRQAGFKSSAEWSLGLKLPSVPHILSMLRGLSMGHLATQRSIDEGGILPLLHALEGVSGEMK